MGTTPKTRTLTVVAQDAHVREGGRILTTTVSVPYEEVEPGPLGHRVHVVDYDASTSTLYDPAAIADGPTRPSNAAVLGDPAFHAQNVYALVMATLARFEYALGRRAAWGFRAHQLKVVPHAFEAANAFYSPESESLSFGYYRRGGEVVFTCLSHDVVVHETTHALLDGLRGYFMAPSSPDQAAFHEGYADIVALLSVLSVESLVARLVDKKTAGAGAPRRRAGLVHRSALTAESLRQTVLFGMADDMDTEAGGARVNALRRSVETEPDKRLLDTEEYREPHRRGEILVAAVMRTFLDVWSARLATLGAIEGDYVDRGRVAEEAATVAGQLLTMMVRAIDYTPPIHVTFGDFLSAALTADAEVRDDDSRYQLRKKLLAWCGKYGIRPASGTRDGTLPRSDLRLGREGVRFGSLQTDATEMFRLLWANRRNREALRLDPRAFTQVSSIRPSVRIGPEDGFLVRETVAECVQYLKVPAGELKSLGLRKPPGLDDAYEIALRGGSTLVLDEYGTLKFEINNTLPRPGDTDALRETQEQLDYLWEQGEFTEGASFAMRLSSLHRLRALDPVLPSVTEVW
jgi:hypothetical protein